MAHGRLTRRPRHRRPSCKSMAIGTIASVLLAAISAPAAHKPTLLILPLDMVDTSGETPSHAQEHEYRLLALARYLSRALGEDGYDIVDPAPIRATIDKARATQSLAECNGCERDLAKLVHADRVLIGGVEPWIGKTRVRSSRLTPFALMDWTTLVILRPPRLSATTTLLTVRSEP